MTTASPNSFTALERTFKRESVTDQDVYNFYRDKGYTPKECKAAQIFGSETVYQLTKSKPQSHV